MVPVINKANPLFKEIMSRGIKKTDLQRIWLDEQTPSWNGLLGSQGGVQVHVYTRSDSCGAAETWAMFLGKKQEDLLGIGIFGDPGLNEAVRKDALGIGFNNINYAYDATTLKPMADTAILPIELNGNGKLDAEEKFYDDPTPSPRPSPTTGIPARRRATSTSSARGSPTPLLLQIYLIYLGLAQQLDLVLGAIT